MKQDNVIIISGLFNFIIRWFGIRWIIFKTTVECHTLSQHSNTKSIKLNSHFLLINPLEKDWLNSSVGSILYAAYTKDTKPLLKHLKPDCQYVAIKITNSNVSARSKITALKNLIK